MWSYIKLHIVKDKRKHYVITKRSSHQENIVILSVHMLDCRASEYTKQKTVEIKGEIDIQHLPIEDYINISQVILMPIQ